MFSNVWAKLLFYYNSVKMYSSIYITILLMLLFISLVYLFIRWYIKKLIESVEKERTFSKSIIDNTNLLVVEWKFDGSIVLFNRFAQKVTGYKEKQILGKSWSIFVDKDSFFYTPKFNEIITKNEGVSIEKSITCKDGSKRYINWNINVIRSVNDEVLHFVAIGNDVSEKREALQRIRRLAYTDIHTGLPNNAKLQEQLRKTIDLTKKQNKKFALIMFDMYNLKKINDNYNNAFTD